LATCFGSSEPSSGHYMRTLWMHHVRMLRTGLKMVH